MSIPIPFSPAHSPLIGNEEGLRKRGKQETKEDMGLNGRKEKGQKRRGGISFPATPLHSGEGKEEKGKILN